jgi:hydroxyacid-oxoacid transhydrogenase
LVAAKALGADINHAQTSDAGQILADRVIHFMQTLAMPRGLKEVGYSMSDMAALVEGTLAQQRLLKLSPCHAGPDELATLFEDSIQIW